MLLYWWGWLQRVGIARQRSTSNAPQCIDKTRRDKRCTQHTNNDNGLCGQYEGTDTDTAQAPAFASPVGAAPTITMLEDIAADPHTIADELIKAEAAAEAAAAEIPDDGHRYALCCWCKEPVRISSTGHDCAARP